MQVAISTQSLADSTAEALQRAADLGFSHVEINLLSDEFGYGHRRRPNVRFYREIQQQLKQLNLKVWSVTAPILTQEQMFSQRARKEVLINAVGAAGILEAQVFVAEPAHLFKDEDGLVSYLNEGGVPPIVTGFDEAWAQVVNRRMTFALPNIDYWLGQPLTNNAEQLQKITFDLGIGWVLDLPNALGRHSLDRWLTEPLKERIAHAYLYAQDPSGEIIAPSVDQCQQWLADLQQTRIKCIVLHCSPDEPNSTIKNLSNVSANKD